MLNDTNGAYVSELPTLIFNSSFFSFSNDIDLHATLLHTAAITKISNIVFNLLVQVLVNTSLQEPAAWNRDGFPFCSKKNST